MENKKYIFHVHGMHCQACVFLTESELIELPNVSFAKSNLAENTVTVSGEFGDKTNIQIAEELSAVLIPHGYTLSAEKENKKKNWSEFKIAIPVALLFVIVFIILQKIGLVNLVGGNNITYGTAFVVGIIASLSTCMAVVGGLVLSMSATFAKEGDRIRPQVLFHIGRIVSFFVLGGVIGLIGSTFTLSSVGSFVISLVIGIVMLILGINLLDVFPWAKSLQPSVPKFISKRVHSVTKFTHTLTPLFVGVVTFFLPCGFTQSMQIYTLSTGSFLGGGLTMLIFALGTLPILALLSFSSFSIKKSSKSGIFFKSAGLIVILFALFNLISSLVAIGLIPPIFNF